MITFDPAKDPRKFRSALGQFATGVCVITTRTDDGQAVGITANSFASVSLDPALVLWSPAKAARRFPVFAEARHFAVHVLSTEQEAVANGFVQEANAFSGLNVTDNAHGTPLLEGCVARFECVQEAMHDAGDHAIIVGRVITATQAQAAPLVFHSGQYRRFTQG